jgi:signal transduction histidine kinase
MSSAPEAVAPRAAPRMRAFGLRLALWYALLFVLGEVAIVVLTYELTASSLAERDRMVLDAKVGQYATEYERGGLGQLTETVRAEQSTAPERLFVRVVDRGSEAIVMSMPEGWDPKQLETASLRLADGTLVQVAKSTELREELLARFRATLGIVLLSIVAVALAGGWLATRSATTRMREMLDRIDRLVTAMRDSLDNVSHDLRTPLTHLRVAAETALAGAPDAVREREALADAVEQVDRVLVILDSLMDLAEAQGGTLKLKREPVPLDDVAARALDLYRDVAESRGVALDPAPADAAVVTLGDRPRLEQAAANLIDNAIKYTPAGGRVEVSVGRDGGDALLTVRDTGRGIPPSDLPRIFDRLFRGDSSRSERGLGLGLSLVRAIVEAHGGRVEVESEVGRGSTFVVRLPAAPGGTR